MKSLLLFLLVVLNDYNGVIVIAFDCIIHLSVPIAETIEINDSDDENDNDNDDGDGENSEQSNEKSSESQYSSAGLESLIGSENTNSESYCDGDDEPKQDKSTNAAAAETETSASETSQSSVSEKGEQCKHSKHWTVFICYRTNMTHIFSYTIQPMMKIPKR